MIIIQELTLLSLEQISVLNIDGVNAENE